MWRIADGCGIEQPDGSFLDQQTHTSDPQLSLDPMREPWPVVRWNGHLRGVFTGKLLRRHWNGWIRGRLPMVLHRTAEPPVDYNHERTFAARRGWSVQLDVLTQLTLRSCVVTTLADLARKFDLNSLSPDWMETSVWGFIRTRTEPVSARQYLRFSELDVEEGNTPRHLINAITNAKRALHLRMEDICNGFGFEKIRSPRNFPSMVEFISSLGITAPRLLVRLNKLRNEVEHDYVLPSQQDVETFLDVASLFVAATDRWVDRQPCEAESYGNAKSAGDGIELTKMRFDWERGVVKLDFREVGSRSRGPHVTTEFHIPSDEFFVCARFAIELDGVR